MIFKDTYAKMISSKGSFLMTIQDLKKMKN